MKLPILKQTLTACLLLTSFMALGQNLTYKDLTTILSKPDWDKVNDYLMLKGWKYHESSSETTDKYGTITWSYGKSSYDDKALGWVYLGILNDKPARVRFQFHVKPIYTSIKSAFITAGLKQASSTVHDDGLEVFYTGNTYYGYLITTTSENDFSAQTTVYTAKLEKKQAFLSQFETIETGGDTSTDLSTTSLNDVSPASTHPQNGSFKED